MSAFLCPSFGAAFQGFSNTGAVLAGGKLYSYQAGSTTALATWTDSTQSVQNANPMILNSAGRTTAEIWLQGGSSYKFVLTDSSNNILSTWDYLSGVNDANYLGFSEWVAFGSAATYASATTFTINGNQTSIFQSARRVQLFQLGGTLYGTVSTSSYSSGTGLTTVTVSLDSGTLDNTLYSVSYGFMSATNTSLPALFIQALNAALTGIPTAPTAAAGTDTTQIATTAFVQHPQSPAMTGTPTAPTASAGVSTTQVATTAFAMNMQSPAFSGTPTAPTAVAGTNNTQIATTAFATALAFAAALPAQSLTTQWLSATNDGSTARWGVSAAEAMGIFYYIGY